VFVLDPLLLAAPDAGPQRMAFLLGGLRALDLALRARGSRLIVRRGDPSRELARLLSETGADAIYAEGDTWPYARSRDARVSRTLPLHLVGGLTLYPPQATLKADGTPYTVFTPFSRKWRSLPPPQAGEVLPAPARIPTSAEIESLPIPDEPALSSAVPFPPGEAEAQSRLSAFVDGENRPIYQYEEGRDWLDLDGTSRLSPYLRFGMLSTRQAVVAARRAIEIAPDTQARAAAQVWLDELIWREFYQTILHHFPHVLEQPFRPDLQSIAWENDEAAFAAWREGCTGYPVVDAGMRQLARTGWMHNRARMIVASAAPYFRVFNPVLQGHKYDPRGAYVRRWVPELIGVPDKFIHQPWKMPPDMQRAAGCVVGRDYPAPIVEHAPRTQPAPRHRDGL